VEVGEERKACLTSTKFCHDYGLSFIKSDVKIEIKGWAAMPYLNSSAISRAEYNSSTRTLSIWFKESGGPYDYYHVPENIYQGLIRASSAGSYFNRYIGDRYSSNR
jgi:hypothetical protein